MRWPAGRQRRPAWSGRCVGRATFKNRPTGVEAKAEAHNVKQSPGETRASVITPIDGRSIGTWVTVDGFANWVVAGSTFSPRPQERFPARRETPTTPAPTEDPRHHEGAAHAPHTASQPPGGRPWDRPAGRRGRSRREPRSGDRGHPRPTVRGRLARAARERGGSAGSRGAATENRVQCGGGAVRNLHYASAVCNTRQTTAERACAGGGGS
jgi:hypothetical protein